MGVFCCSVVRQVCSQWVSGSYLYCQVSGETVWKIYLPIPDHMLNRHFFKGTVLKILKYIFFVFKQITLHFWISVGVGTSEQMFFLFFLVKKSLKFPETFSKSCCSSVVSRHGVSNTIRELQTTYIYILTYGYLCVSLCTSQNFTNLDGTLSFWPASKEMCPNLKISVLIFHELLCERSSRRRHKNCILALWGQVSSQGYHKPASDTWGHPE
jgi:hypothetical protein